MDANTTFVVLVRDVVRRECDDVYVAQQGSARPGRQPDDPLQLDVFGRRVAITGAGQGIGRGLALATAGAEVLINDLRGADADSVVEGVRQREEQRARCRLT